jgi:integrase
MKFTDMFISKLKPGAKQYVKRESRGFAVRVLPSGFKTWIFIYTMSGKRRQMNLGDYPDISLSKARERADTARQEFKNGKDPQDVGFDWHRNPKRDREEAARLAEEERKNPTVKKLVEMYIEGYAKVKKRSWRADERMLNFDVVTRWGDRYAKDVKKRDVIELLKQVLQRGPTICRLVHLVLRKMFAWAVEQDILEYNPSGLVKCPAPKYVPRDRALSKDEIRTFWSQLEGAAISGEIRRALRLTLVTGQRPGEVIGMHTSEIDDRWWTIPVERSKNKTAHRVYLTDTAMELIGDTTFTDPVTGEDVPKGYIFPSPRGENHIIETAMAYALRRNLKGHEPQRKDPDPNKKVKMFRVAEEKKMDIAHFTPHDLRRTTATAMAEMRVSDEVIDAVLNHVKTGVIKVYNIYKYDREKKQALEAWERKLTGITTGTGEKVISINKGRKRA